MTAGDGGQQMKGQLAVIDQPAGWLACLLADGFDWSRLELGTVEASFIKWLAGARSSFGGRAGEKKALELATRRLHLSTCLADKQPYAQLSLLCWVFAQIGQPPLC